MKTTPTFLNLFLLQLNHLFISFLKPFLIKLKFKGKGYYVFKSTRSTVTPQFGFAHRRYFYTTSFRVKFLSKTKIVLFGFSKGDVLKVAFEFQTYKPINVFTGRGVRFAKQIIYRKTGKVSLYR
jgi:ribosomal protein L6P/L9E